MKEQTCCPERRATEACEGLSAAPLLESLPPSTSFQKNYNNVEPLIPSNSIYDP